MNSYLHQLESTIVTGGLLDLEQVLQLADRVDLDALCAAADRICKHFNGNKVDLCTIMNVKSGKCSENCKYCAQSGHYHTQITEYPLLPEEVIVEQALQNQQEGVHRFALVTSGRGSAGADFEQLLAIIRGLKAQTRLKICGSFGIITFEQAVRLKQAGLDRYHHNLETSADFFERICDTHSYQDRVATIQAVKAAGLEVCCGGIIGMGESMEQRLRLALAIRELGVKSVPVNILNPIKGTPLAGMPLLAPAESLKTMALFRLILPDAWIRYAGGRLALGNWQSRGLEAGVNAALVGNCLTTVGNRISDDMQMIKGLGLEVCRVG